MRVGLFFEFNDARSRVATQLQKNIDRSKILFLFVFLPFNSLFFFYLFLALALVFYLPRLPSSLSVMNLSPPAACQQPAERTVHFNPAVDPHNPSSSSFSSPLQSPVVRSMTRLSFWLLPIHIPTSRKWRALSELTEHAISYRQFFFGSRVKCASLPISFPVPVPASNSARFFRIRKKCILKDMAHVRLDCPSPF